MHRFFITPDNITDDKVIILGTDVAHMRTVLRLKEGDRVQVLDGRGNCYTIILTKVSRDQIESTISLKEDASNCESPLRICLGQGMVKGTGFDGIVRKSVELGVDKIVPISATRSISKLSQEDSERKMNRWCRISREASKQCGRSSIPTIGPKSATVKEFCFTNRESDLKIIFWEEERSFRIKNLLHISKLKSAAILIGPEGGFSSKEVDVSREYGFQSVSLGPRLLRTDTAPLAAISIIQNHWGDL
jgi:16S rRNA (uracil1498-N3)-methyltransferase